MQLFRDKRFYKFLIPSLIGIFLFVTPVVQNGNLTIPIAVASNWLLNGIQEYTTTIIWLLISVSTVITILFKMLPQKFLSGNPKIQNLFQVKGIWFIIRILGFIIVNMIYFQIGPEMIIGETTGGMVIHDLLPILVCIFFLAGLLLALLLNYGLLDLFGALLIRIMRPIFNLPGRSALDCVASWLGDGSIGVLLTSRQYEEGFYSKREATVIATTFSAVSITFSLVVISEVNLSHMFLPFYLAVSLAGIAAAVIIPKLPPLSWIPNTYYRDTCYKEDIPEGISSGKYGLQLALQKAEKAPGIQGLLREGMENVLEMWFGTIPVILAMGTIALIIAAYTSVFQILGTPFVCIYQLLQIPEAKEASQTVLIGFADMFLPSVLGSSINSELTRFVIAATSVTQLIYMSEIGSIIMSSKIPVSLLRLFVIFIERTLVTLPIIALSAHLLF